jgi:hypothetical protein
MIKVSNKACLRIKFAFSWSPAPLYLAAIAVAPTFMAIKIVMRRNFGCTVRPTEVKAQAPKPPTIIKSTIEAS